MLTAREIIDRRRELWENDSDIERDKAYVQAAAEHIVSAEGAGVRQEIQTHPEYLIEMAFTIVDKTKQTVPFFLNDVQQRFVSDLNQAIEDYRHGRRLYLKFLVLKGRQQGFTSVITAYQLACCITKRNFSGFTLADDSENTETIFEDKAKFPYSQLPEALQPSVKYNNRREFHFEKLNSRWRVATAGGKSVGRSKTLNFFHGSEAGFWGDISTIMAGLDPALTKDSIQILESTANGYNQFKELWDEDNNWECKFYEWWLTPDYRQAFESGQVEREFRATVQRSKTWIYQRCKWLIDFAGLSLEQVYWYYKKWIDLKDLIKQEYPCTADEAFLASGACVFDKEKIILRKEVLKKKYDEQPPITGRFSFAWNDPDTRDKILDSTIQFVEDPSGGFIRLYEKPQAGCLYAIGGDTKGEGSDRFAATAINHMTGNRCATLHGNMDPDTYTHQVYCLGRYFNDALIGIETNFNTYPVEELSRLQYPNQYVRKKYDDYTGSYLKKYGFKTDGNTRPLIIDKEIILIRDCIDLFNDIEFLNECLTFIYDENGRPDAESGKHDDILFSDMIANEIRGQQGFARTGLAPDDWVHTTPPKGTVEEILQRLKKEREEQEEHDLWNR